MYKSNVTKCRVTVNTLPPIISKQTSYKYRTPHLSKQQNMKILHSFQEVVMFVSSELKCSRAIYIFVDSVTTQKRAIIRYTSLLGYTRASF